MEIELLDYAMNQTDDVVSAARLDESILQSLASLRFASASGSYRQLDDDVMELKSQVLKRSYTYGEGLDSSQLSALRQSLIEEYRALRTQSSSVTSRITAPAAGVFSSLADGYESLLTPALLETITPGQLSQLDRQRPQPDAGAVGKLVTDATWYFVCAMGEEEAGRLIEGRTVTVRFSRDWSGEVDMKVERVGETPENGRVAVVLSSDRYLSETTLLRKQTVELVFDSQTGIRVPTQSVRVEERTVTDPETEEEKQELVTGVYVLVGQQAEFKPVTILAQLEDFALVKSADGSDGKKALRAGDEVILSSVELFDGKVITQS